MLRNTILLCAVMLLLNAWSVSVPAQEDVPHLVTYSGNAIDFAVKSGEKPNKLDGIKTFDLVVRIYNAETAGEPLWEEHFADVAFTFGNFQVVLGSPDDLDLDFLEDYWVSIELDDRDEFTYRDKLTSAGYAYVAQNALTFGGYEPGDFAMKGHKHPGEDITSPVAESYYSQDSNLLDGKDSTDFALVDHEHDLTHEHAFVDLSDISTNEAAALNAAGDAGASAENRLATIMDIGAGSGLWTDEGTYIYPNNIGTVLRITDTGNFTTTGSVGIGTDDPWSEFHLHGAGRAISYTVDVPNASFDIMWSDYNDPKPGGPVNYRWDLTYRGSTPPPNLPHAMHLVKGNADGSPGEVVQTWMPSGNVGIGNKFAYNAPEYKLDVDGYVQAQGYHTGDIIFQKDNQKLWRMFEDEAGLYVESLKSGKVYKIVLQEIDKN